MEHGDYFLDLQRNLDEHPDDSMNALVLADYLEQHGSFMECELLRRGAEYTEAEGIDERQRIAAIIEGLRIDLCSQLGADNIGLRKNMVYRLCINAGTLLQNIDHFRHQIPLLESITLTGIRPEQWEELPQAFAQLGRLSEHSYIDELPRLKEHMKKYDLATMDIGLSLLGIGTMTAEELLEKAKQEQEKGNIPMAPVVECMIENRQQFIDPVNKRYQERKGVMETLGLVHLCVQDLGFKNVPVIAELLGNSNNDGHFVEAPYLQEIGLELCPPETGLYQRFADTNQRRWYRIAMEPIVDSRGGPRIFHCEPARDIKPSLHGYFTHRRIRWDFYEKLIFLSP